MVAEAQNQRHSGLGRLEDGRNGLTSPNIVRLGGELKETNSTYCFGGLKEEKVFGAFYVEICKAVD